MTSVDLQVSSEGGGGGDRASGLVLKGSGHFPIEDPGRTVLDDLLVDALRRATHSVRVKAR